MRRKKSRQAREGRRFRPKYIPPRKPGRIPPMLPHEFPHPPRTQRIIAKVHHGIPFEGGGSTHNPNGAFHTNTTKGFKHVRGKGPPGKLCPDEPPRGMGHKTPEIRFTRHSATWGGPSDQSAGKAYHSNKMQAKHMHRPSSKDGHWRQKTKKTTKGVKATHGSMTNLPQACNKTCKRYIKACLKRGRGPYIIEQNTMIYEVKARPDSMHCILYTTLSHRRKVTDNKADSVHLSSKYSCCQITSFCKQFEHLIPSRTPND